MLSQADGDLVKAGLVEFVLERAAADVVAEGEVAVGGTHHSIEATDCHIRQQESARSDLSIGS